MATEQQLKYWESMKGRKQTEEWKAKMMGREPWNKGKKTGIAPWKGKKLPQEMIEKLRQSRLGQPAWNKGLKGFRAGKRGPRSEETKKKLSQFRGEKASNWRGGKTLRISTRPKPEHCEVCKIPANQLKSSLCFDHDHKTGKFRGWLCRRCNLALGHVSDSKEILMALIRYLEENEVTK